MERVAVIAELSEILGRAEAASGYRLDGLLDILSGSGDEPAGGRPGKKPVKKPGHAGMSPGSGGL
jgi:hypothetical protein